MKGEEKAMRRSIGLLEYKSIAKGMEACDEMLKSSNVKLVLASPVCPGKYIVILSGDVGAVENAVKVGINIGGSYLISDYLIANVHENVFPAITGTIDIGKIDSLGIVETISAVASIIAGDVALKAANIDLLEIRIAKGLCGKGYMLMTGEVSAVKSAVEACESRLIETGEIISTVTIPSPSKELISSLL